MNNMLANVFPGVLKKARKFDIFSEVVVSISQSFEIVSVITSDSFDYLNAQEGCKVSCLVKPTDVLLGKSVCCQKVGVPNCFPGRIVEINAVGIGVEVLTEIFDGNFIKALTVQEQVDLLDLKKDDSVYVFFKEFSVVLVDAQN